MDLLNPVRESQCFIIFFLINNSESIILILKKGTHIFSLILTYLLFVPFG